ncbi:MAG: bifunctional folylpolyglutamate synthase/dihydrofolate synthase, partial [Gaiellaceae bacterium]
SARSWPATAVSSMPSAAEAYLESLSPWPEEFGLGRMRELLERLGHPERRYPAVHVVGTNGKSTTASMTEALLQAQGLRVGAYLSPHVVSWRERIRIDGAEVDLDALVDAVRTAGVEDATQFEVLTAAALHGFAEADVAVAVVEAGLGGRLDATNVLDAKVVVLTNVGLDHSEHLGSTREEIAAEKLAVVPEGATVVLGEPEWEEAAKERGAGEIVFARGNRELAVAAASAFVGKPVEPGAADSDALPGRFELIGSAPLEIWDGAHNPEGVRFLLELLPERDYVLVCSVLADKDVDAMLGLFSERSSHLVATVSENPRVLPAQELARHGAAYFSEVEVVPDPVLALQRAREVAGPTGAVLVAGSLYLLTSLAAVRSGYVPWDTLATG